MKHNETKNFIYEISQRLADEPDYEDYLKPKLEQTVDHLNDLWEVCVIADEIVLITEDES